MAEQIDHDVVINSESAGTSVPAGVAANHKEIESAVSGTNSTITTATLPEGLSDAKSANEAATDTNLSVSEETILGGAAEPSAGDAALKPEEGSLAAEASAEPSIASDTEGSRADGAERKEGDNMKSTMLRKAPTFSKVSVTKNFMAKSASPVPAAPKIGEKPSPLTTSTQPAALKPRLVAKTASSLQGVPRTGAVPAGGPDASKVWNKNRPVPPPPPKHFTDEELKQQYGIHLATRLQTDENGKEVPKWADIDDDEDDWAPETVVWMDGTKSTLTPSEITPIQKDLPLSAPQAVRPAETARPILAVKRPGEGGAPKVILKSTSGAQQAKQQPNGTAPSPTPGEKPALKPMSPAPAPPVKSPWAKLPAVEAVPLINPPVQQPMPSAPLPSQDARMYEPQPSPTPAREIAADTFDRSWHEGEGAPRELFNSANGRYEPVAEGRRGSIRPDSIARKTSLLHRSSQTGQGAAETSPAFQSRTSSQVDGASWSRRRGSSVSHGSLPPGRRMSVSVSHPSDLSPAPEDERRQSTATAHDLRASPMSARNEPQEPTFSQQSAWDQQMPPQPEAGMEAEHGLEDPLKAQERIMREKREEARKRRQEEEERLEREKRERLQAKLAALESAGKSKKEREAEAVAAATVPHDNESLTNQTTDQQRTTGTNSEEPPAVLPQAAEVSAELAPALEDQSLPASAVPKEPPQEILPSPLAPRSQPLTGLSELPISAADQGAKQPLRAHLSPGTASRTPHGTQQSPYKAPPSSYSSPGDRKQQPFIRSPFAPNDTFGTWSTPAPNGNVWGSSGIGNGTFEKASNFAPVPMSQTSGLPLPHAPGMPQPPGSTRISPQTFGQDARSPSLQQQPPAESTRTFPPPGLESRPEHAWGASRHAGMSPAPGLGRSTHLPGPIAPPSRAQQQAQHPAPRPDAISAWNNAASRLPHQYSADAEAAERKQQEGMPAPVVPPRDETIRETFKQTSAGGKLGGPRRYDKTEYIVHDAQGSRAVSTLSPAPPSTQTQPIGPVPTASPLNEPWKAAVENTVRIPDGSLNPAHGGLPVQQPPIAPPSAPAQSVTAYHSHVHYPTGPLPGVPIASVKDRSPPPPETAEHPAFTGDYGHPRVKFPQPPPVVKLPPAATQTSPYLQQQSLAGPLSGAHQRHLQAWGPPGVVRPLVQNNEWQARFNGLFNRTPIQTEVPPSPPGTPPKAQDPVLAVAAASRAVMEETSAVAATVSLPLSQVKTAPTKGGFVIDDSDDVTSKPGIDEMFAEERSFGSLPDIRMPRNAIYDPGVYRMFRDRTHGRSANAPVTQTEPDWLGFLWPRNPQGIFIKLPGTKLQDSNRLVRYASVAGTNSSRKSSGFHDRKSSGKFHKGKEGKGNSGSTSPGTTTTSNAGSRQTSFQKTPNSAKAAKGRNSNSTPVKAS
ncbi:hypothetical protein BAUCODRAFT_39010 [Baudoinia panamericana UAMH 10762]|uniref:Uncharacterized protein n=1 Tax=Baudoinia panamericana (strain UAMH 10762) TaxID=717646 RepID=M2LD38_BAUPA|nr:uncharacterized protein BAUCODRAFT_39010 [Baudoinia panamericana UAMH 10762]EMC91867.1 hypothetical protein BAUCODRAFT_39010 [Baudoinia panamericana UAMH 10762]